MKTFVAIYRHNTSDAPELVATSSTPHVLGLVADILLRECQSPLSDPILEAVRMGKEVALDVLRHESINAAFSLHNLCGDHTATGEAT